MSAYQIRAASQQDLDAVYAVFNLADELHRNAHPEIFQKVEDSSYREYLLNCIHAVDIIILVAELDGQVVAALNARICQSPDSPAFVKRTYLSVDNLVVGENHRQQGLGQALMRHLHEWAQQQGLESVYLTVWEFNQVALTFYEKLGYQMLHHRMRRKLP